MLRKDAGKGVFAGRSLKGLRGDSVLLLVTLLL